MFPGLDKPILQIPEAEDDLLLDDDDEDKDKDIEKHLDMPPPWAEPLTLSQRGKSFYEYASIPKPVSFPKVHLISRIDPCILMQVCYTSLFVVFESQKKIVTLCFCPFLAKTNKKKISEKPRNFMFFMRFGPRLSFYKKSSGVLWINL